MKRHTYCIEPSAESILKLLFCDRIIWLAKTTTKHVITAATQFPHAIFKKIGQANIRFLTSECLFLIRNNFSSCFLPISWFWKMLACFLAMRRQSIIAFLLIWLCLRQWCHRQLKFRGFLVERRLSTIINIFWYCKIASIYIWKRCSLDL